MRGGHNRVPTPIAEARGNPGKRPLNHDEPTPAGVQSTTPPEWLNAVAKRHYRKLLGTLYWLTEADLDKLAIYCQAYARYREYTRLMGVLDFGSKEFEGWEYSDVAKVLTGLPIRLKDAELSMASLGSALGMDPVSRTRIHHKKPDAADTFDSWEKGRTG